MTSKLVSYDSFLFSPGLSVEDLVSSYSATAACVAFSALPMLSTLLPSDPLLLASTVSLSCIPIIVPLSSPVSFDESVVLTEDAKSYMKGILFVSLGEASLAVFDAMLGDMTRAVIKASFAALGWYSTRPEGLMQLQNFTVMSFLSGSINGLAALQMVASNPGPLFSGLLPLLINYIRFSDLAFPMLCLGGSYCGWLLLKELRVASAIIDGGAGQALTGSAVVRRRVPQTNANEFRPFSGVAHSLAD